VPVRVKYFQSVPKETNGYTIFSEFQKTGLKIRVSAVRPPEAAKILSLGTNNINSLQIYLWAIFVFSQPPF
jgi:hypothetical protein